MSPLLPRPLLGSLLALALGAASPARAQAELPLPYTDEPGQKATPPAEKDFEHAERQKSYTPSEDPAVGLGAEAFGGLFLLESSRGALADLRWGAGARVVWDWGRLLSDAPFHDALFVDVTWAWTGFTDGTQAVHDTTNIHYLTLAPAYEIPFGEGSPFGFYFQVGGGVALTSSALHADTTQSTQAVQPLLQYGIGLRGRPLVSEDGKLRLTFRLEATRFRRGYLDDTLVLASAGLAF